MEADYILRFRDDEKAELALYSVRKTGGARRMLVRVIGKPARKGHEEIVKITGGSGIALIKSEGKEREYSVRPDLAPIIGSFLLLLRRSRDPSKWCKAFNEVMRGRMMAFGETFARFFDIAVSLSAELKKTSGRKTRGEAVLPEVADAISASLKSFISSIEGVG
ncbi:MAG: hypothetical protein QXT79_08610 [Thermofilaceae archaeon]